MMKYPSEIFDTYATIATEQGLISTAEETNPRYDSQTLSDIEVLYGIKPEGEKDIIEQAHPESVIIAPSYDKLNGLVENVRERQNIMIDIILGPQRGKLTQHRYAQAVAEQELMNELIRLGFQMDNQDEVELTTMADACTEALQKRAWVPVVLAIAGGLGLIGALNHFGYISQGVMNDCDNAVTALEAYSSEVPEISREIKDLIGGIKYVRNLNEKINATSSTLKTSTAGKNIVEAAVMTHSSSEGQTAGKLIETYKRAAVMLADRIVKIYVPLIDSTEPSEERTSSTLWAGLKDAWHMLAGSPKNDALKTLVGANVSAIGEGGLVGSLRKSVAQVTAKENAMKAYAEQNQDSLVSYLQKAESEPTESPASPVTPEEAPKTNLVNDLEGAL